MFFAVGWSCGAKTRVCKYFRLVAQGNPGGFGGGGAGSPLSGRPKLTQSSSELVESIAIAVANGHKPL